MLGAASEWPPFLELRGWEEVGGRALVSGIPVSDLSGVLGVVQCCGSALGWTEAFQCPVHTGWSPSWQDKVATAEDKRHQLCVQWLTQVVCFCYESGRPE